MVVRLVMVDKALSDLVEFEATRDLEDALLVGEGLGVMFWIVTWTLGIVDVGLEAECLGFLVGPRSKLRQ